MAVNVKATFTDGKTGVINSAVATLDHSDEWAEAHGVKKASNSQRLNKLRGYAADVLAAGQGHFTESVSESRTPIEATDGEPAYDYVERTVERQGIFSVSFEDENGVESVYPASAVVSIEIEDDHAEPEEVVEALEGEDEAEEADEDASDEE